MRSILNSTNTNMGRSGHPLMQQFHGLSASTTYTSMHDSLSNGIEIYLPVYYILHQSIHKYLPVKVITNCNSQLSTNNFFLRIAVRNCVLINYILLICIY